MIQYKVNHSITADMFIDLLKRSTLADRRPVHDLGRIEKMLLHGNLLVTAWDGDLLVGISRSLSDFSFCCYLSDLAVDEAYQKKGIGKELIAQTHLASGKHTTLILLAAPKAAEYYPKIGLNRFTDCFLIRAESVNE